MTDISAEPKPVQAIYDWYASNRLIVNRIYQRKLVWTIHEKQKLIDSILRKYPIPLVLIAEIKDDSATVFEIIDGLQRLHTILSFIECQFSLNDGRYFAIEHFTAATNRLKAGEFKPSTDIQNTISSSEVASILNYVLPLSILRNSNSSQITEVFSRINSYGHRLSDQERRQAGLTTRFSNLVRTLACDIRGDVSFDRLTLNKMPEISVDIPSAKFGYQIQASDVFWVKHGILQSTGLRDSMDEQIVADLAASIVLGKAVERSKEKLDSIYDPAREDSTLVEGALQAYGEKRLADEIKYIISLIDQIACTKNPVSLRAIIFKSGTTNPFPTIFSTIFLAFHEIVFKNTKIPSDFAQAYKCLTNITEHLNTGRGSLSEDERNKNVRAAKGMLENSFVHGNPKHLAHSSVSIIDFENLVRRSPVESARFELKQGIIDLDVKRNENLLIIDNVLFAACGIANIGPSSEGHIFVGICDREDHSRRIQEIDKIVPLIIGNRFVVGVDREAKILGISIEKYFHKFRDRIKNSDLSQFLKDALLGNMEVINYRGVSVVHIYIPSQLQLSFVGDICYVRQGDQTLKASGPSIAAASRRFP